ncbi:unnamed protein product [Caenorhabditis bovis]|uniref:K Homology domain-containing protein n=1 Tax=Caenorhabditis bovis TaxID=2654633 RepID=A0A8S1F153_9PELO|nr:unnamed protein product [Caenorhabditis bovis]
MSSVESSPIMDDCSFLTEFQRKCLHVIIEAERDPQTLFTNDETCEYHENVMAYLKKLLIEKAHLQKCGNTNFAIQLIDEEVCRLLMVPVSIPYVSLLEQYGREMLMCSPDVFTNHTLSDESLHSEDNEEVTLTKSVLIPIDEYPSYNFIGRIIGPRGMTAKQLEKDTGCRIMVRGYYLNKIYGRAPRNGLLDENDPSESPLRVVLETTGPRKEANERLNAAINVVKSLLVPPSDGQDELKRRQLVELAVMNGTYRGTGSRKTPAHF